MPKPNITGMSLKVYLSMRLEQLCGRKMTIVNFIDNYLPAWGEVKFTDKDLKAVQNEIDECVFMVNQLKAYHKEADTLSL